MCQEASVMTQTATPMGHLLHMKEVAEITRIDLDTLRYWRHKGEGPPSFRLGRRVVYPEAELHRWIQAQARKESGQRAPG
jgi:predicted DNA-binding transcriptional regulator AlpA